jgi:hypothetical protein
MTCEQGDQSMNSPWQSKSSDRNPELLEHAVMACSHDSVWEAWLLTQLNFVYW